jgi:hypothetical protein
MREREELPRVGERGINYFCTQSSFPFDPKKEN